jgi:enamine deaminase RidA (YjgF/YER057c/UK114 family)
MPFPTIATPSNANRIAAAIQSVYVRPNGEKYQTLGAIRDAELAIEDYVQADGRRKNKAFAKTVTAKATMMQCTATEIELLDSLVNGTNDFLFKMADAAAIPVTTPAVTGGWFLFTSGQIGVKPKIVLSGNVEKNAEIQLEFSGSLQFSEVDAAVKASIVDTDFESSTETGAFHTIGTYGTAKDGGRPKQANIKSCGISSLTLADTGGAAQTLGPVDDPTIEFDYIAETDSLNVFRPRFVNVNAQYSWKQTDSVNLLNLDTFTDEEIDAVITMKSGLVMTLTNQVGIGARLESVGDYERTRAIVFKHQGSVLVTDIDAIFS